MYKENCDYVVIATIEGRLFHEFSLLVDTLGSLEYNQSNRHGDWPVAVISHGGHEQEMKNLCYKYSTIFSEVIVTDRDHALVSHPDIFAYGQRNAESRDEE